MKIKYLFLCAWLLSPMAFSKVIYGIENIPHHQDSSELPIYVQMGSFENKKYVHILVREIRIKNYSNVMIKPYKEKYKILVGPFENLKDLNKFYDAFKDKKLKTIKKDSVPERESLPLKKPLKVSEHIPSLNQNQWYLTGQVGGQYNNLSSSATVNNGSGFSSPYSQDRYSAKSNDGSLLLGVGLGKRYQLDNTWMTFASLGLHYQYFFENNITGDVTQFSLPEFTNYHYKWPVASNVIFANGKFNFKDFNNISPYFSVGLGGVIHQSSGYTEQAYSNVTPRISPDFAVNSESQFAYLLGIGVDYPLGQQMMVNAGYQFSGLGQAKSGPGKGSWSQESLNFGSLNSNAFVFGLTYLVDNHLLEK